MARFGNRLFADNENLVDWQAACLEIHARAAVLVQQGKLPADYRTGLKTMRDVRLMVEAAEKEAQHPADVTGMQKRLEALELAWIREIDDEKKTAIFGEMTELQAAIDDINGGPAEMSGREKELFGEVGQPLTWRQAENIRNRYAAFRAGGGTYNGLDEETTPRSALEVAQDLDDAETMATREMG